MSNFINFCDEFLSNLGEQNTNNTKLDQVLESGPELVSVLDPGLGSGLGSGLDLNQKDNENYYINTKSTMINEKNVKESDKLKQNFPFSELPTNQPELSVIKKELPSDVNKSQSDFAENAQIIQYDTFRFEFIDITKFLTMPQNRACKLIHMRPSTFSKRWKEATNGRKWPWRKISKIDKQLECILRNVNLDNIPKETETILVDLLRERQEELRPVAIRLG